MPAPVASAVGSASRFLAPLSLALALMVWLGAFACVARADSLVFSYEPLGGDSDIWEMAPSGKHRKKLTHFGAGTGLTPAQTPGSGFGWPSVSRSGRRMAFVGPGGSSGDADANVFVSGRDGARPRQITHRRGFRLSVRGAAISPSGDRVAFTDGRSILFTISTRGRAQPKRIAQLPKSTGSDHMSWTPRGGDVLAGGKAGALVAVDVATGRVRTIKLPDDDLFTFTEAPVMSRSGGKIAFGCEADDPNNPDLCIADADGSHAHVLAEPVGRARGGGLYDSVFQASFSPNGRHIAFSCALNFRTICTMRTSGGTRDEIGKGRSPVWID